MNERMIKGNENEHFCTFVRICTDLSRLGGEDWSENVEPLFFSRV